MRAGDCLSTVGLMAVAVPATLEKAARSMVGFRRPVFLGSAVTGVAFVLLAAGCGGRGGSPGVASVAASTTVTTTTQTGLVAFSSCVRAHGVPNFPDPQRLAGGNLKLTIHQLGADDPRVRTATDHCSYLLPNRGGSPETAQQTRAQLADELSFARCMRKHGVSRFPDPSAQGGLSVEMVQAQGIDVHSPLVLRVVEECIPASHGGLTLAKVKEAIDNARG
jgi:hypothetical protein